MGSLRIILTLVLLLMNFDFIYSQKKYNNQKNTIDIKRTFKTSLFESYKIQKNDKFSAILFNHYYINTNLPNFENNNGLYFQKGYGSISSALYQYNSKYFYFSFEPRIIIKNTYQLEIPKKNDLFSVLNDVNNPSINELSNIVNNGFKFYFNNLTFGRGNWNQWWGPGIHNSLILSNNAEGIYKNFISFASYENKYNINYKLKYEISDPIKNTLGSNFYITSFFFNIKYKFTELGFSKNIYSGGHPDINWSKKDAYFILINNNKYWDTICDYFINFNFPQSGLEIFLEFGYPNRTYNNRDRAIYPGHARASNIGLRKKGAFNNKFVLYGFEYTRLINSLYYNILPSPNWYDNKKLDYSSYKGRRWSAHSGADSDDLLVFIGYENNLMSIVYGVNYERHGVNYHYPPEVKLESRLDISYQYNNLLIITKYENEYFEHYGFVDSNLNVLNKTYEAGSIQRTQSLLVSFIYKIN